MLALIGNTKKALMGAVWLNKEFYSLFKIFKTSSLSENGNFLS
jgi:hypothetical protein